MVGVKELLNGVDSNYLTSGGIIVDPWPRNFIDAAERRHCRVVLMFFIERLQSGEILLLTFAWMGGNLKLPPSAHFCLVLTCQGLLQPFCFF